MATPGKKESHVGLEAPPTPDQNNIGNDTDTWSTVDRENASPWTKENEYIIDGYRPQLSACSALESVLRRHNETLNIWTHLIATITFIGLYYWTVPPILKFYCIGAIVCFASSTIFHIFLCVSKETFAFLATADYIGILFHLTTTSISWLYVVYGFSIFGVFYFLCEMILFIFVIRYILTDEQFHDIEMRVWRSLMIVLYVSPSIFPMSQIYFGIVKCESCFDWNIFMGVLSCLLGVLCYVLNIPEKYGIFGNYTSLIYSHAIFHAFVYVGSIFFYLNFSKLYKQKLYELIFDR